MTPDEPLGFELEIGEVLEDLAPRAEPTLLTRSVAAAVKTRQQRQGARNGLPFVPVPAWVALGGVAALGVVVGIVLGFADWRGIIGRGASPHPTASASGPQASPPPTTGWVEPTEYRFVLESSCGERNLLGTFDITVRNGQATAYQALDEQAAVFVGSLGDMPTLGKLMARREEMRNVEFDRDGHPTLINFDPVPQAIDDEECYRIGGYDPTPSTGAEPVRQSEKYRDWSRADLPDPAPDVFGGATPADVVSWNGGYVAVGSINADCCADGDPSLDHGVVWTSADGQTWQANADDPTFNHARLSHVVADGERLLATGTYAAPLPDEPGVPIAALWSSNDGANWRRVPGDVPTLVAALNRESGPSGFVGARVGATRSTGHPFTTFMTSSDGVSWKATSASWSGAARDLAVDPDGAVVAVGESNRDLLGSEGSDAIVWFSADGENWPRPYAVAPHAVLSSVAFAAGRYLAVGAGDSSRNSTEGPSLWTSTNGHGWTKHEIPIGEDESFNRVFVAPAGFLISSRTADGVKLNAQFLTAAAGVTWEAIREQAAFSGASSELLGMVGTVHHVLAVGYRWDPATSHPIPVVWESDL
jgi:hypothetical protein